MNLEELLEKAESIMSNIKDNGVFLKENNLIDYKEKLSIKKDWSPLENFLSNFAKDIISFANSDGGIIVLGIEENKETGRYFNIGLDDENIELLQKLDLNEIIQKFTKITKSSGINLDLQKYRIGAGTFFYIVIAKSYQILLPQNSEYKQYGIHKGDIYYRVSSKNEQANLSTSHFNSFLQIKANERSKEFMEIWSNLLPEMIDINPREILILNPDQNKVYGFNSKDNKLSGSDVEIVQDEDGVFNIILSAISAGEIGKITTDTGKPLFKIMGELKEKNRDRIPLATVVEKVQEKALYKCDSQQVKLCMYHLGWVSDPKFPIQNPPEGTLVDEFKDFIYIGATNTEKGNQKVLFSKLAADKIVPVINNESLHQQLFEKGLKLKKE